MYEMGVSFKLFILTGDVWWRYSRVCTNNICISINFKCYEHVKSRKCEGRRFQRVYRKDFHYIRIEFQLQLEFIIELRLSYHHRRRRRCRHKYLSSLR